MTATDSELVLRTLDGDHSAFGILVERHRVRVCSVAFGVLMDPEDAQDAAQSAFVRAFERIRDLRFAERFGVWIIRIADREARSLARRKRREFPVDPSFLPESSVAPVDTIASDDAAVRQLLFDSIERLPDAYRIPLMLRYMGRASYKDIADSMMISVDTAHARVRRALAILRTHCERVGLHAEDADSLCARCLTFPIALSLADTVIAQIRNCAVPKPVDGGTLTRQVACAVFGGAAVLTALSGFYSPEATDEVAPSPDGAKTIQLTLLGEMKRRVIRETDESRSKPDDVHEILTPGEEHLGWLPTNPRKDATNVAFQRDAYVSGAGGAVVANDEGVYKPSPPLRGTVSLDVWVKPTAPSSDVGIGFRLGEGADAGSAGLLTKNERNFWTYAKNGVTTLLGPVNPVGERIRIVYRTDSATFDVYRDGVLADSWIPIPNREQIAAYRDRPVTGVSLTSGRGGVGAPLYFDDMRLTYTPATEKRRVFYPPAPEILDVFRLVASNVNGGASPDDDVLVVESDSDVKGYAEIEMKSVHDENGVFMAVVVPGWGDRTRNFTTAIPRLPTGVSRHRVAFEVKAPKEEGEYYLWFIGGTETEGAFVASGTNWPNKQPVWNDRNDIADWREPEYRAASQRGYVATRILQDDGVYTGITVAAACLRVRVEPPSVARR